MQGEADRRGSSEIVECIAMDESDFLRRQVIVLASFLGFSLAIWFLAFLVRPSQEYPRRRLVRSFLLSHILSVAVSLSLLVGANLYAQSIAGDTWRGDWAWYYPFDSPLSSILFVLVIWGAMNVPIFFCVSLYELVGSLLRKQTRFRDSPSR